jgi:hypothetical protein
VWCVGVFSEIRGQILTDCVQFDVISSETTDLYLEQMNIEANGTKKLASVGL